MVMDTVLYFDVRSIPKIHSKNVPNQITNVKYYCNLSKLDAIDQNKITSQLLKALF